MDPKRDLTRTVQNIISKWAPPRMWSQDMTASTAIKLSNKSDTRQSEELRRSSYINDRVPRRAKFTNSSSKKIGRESIKNRLKH